MYSDKLIDHFLNPRNAGALENANGRAAIGDPNCGDYLCMFIRVEDMRIADISFLCKGCPASIASASATTEMAIGRYLEEAILLKPEDVVVYLDGMPEEKQHCSNLGVTALWYAMADYLGLIEKENKEDVHLKLAIADDGGFVSAHFGHCAEYKVFEVENGRVVAETAIPTPAHEPCALPAHLAQFGIDHVIAGGMGMRAQENFRSYGIGLTLGVSGAIREVLTAYLDGTLAGGESACSHGEGGCGGH